ncbi:hypothetical protein LSH36_354g02012 [Paralvinella palmiformis]|uniref:Uncharacterized protein n=1 Tax=Paralvinella palmiformis TaxID=53620 RepID=A0AAD9JFX9_9ANNE|nr:hypothetical protein LSH36_354g02012 [Paralvinella palmiformis]
MNPGSNKLDFIGLTEVSHIHENVSYSIDGYHPIIYKTRPDNARGRGGVGLYINEYLQYIVKQDLSVFISDVHESLFVEIESYGIVAILHHLRI